MSVCAKKEKKKKKRRTRTQESERVIKEEKKCECRICVRPIEIARCCIVIRRLNRNNTQEGREREREKEKKKKIVVRASMFVTVTLVRRAHILKE